MLKPRFTLIDIILDEQIKKIIIDEGKIKPFRIEQFLQWIFNYSYFDLGKMSNLDKLSKKFFSENIEILPLKISSTLKEEETDTIKILLETQDSYLIEMVILKDDGRNTLCLSSQIGCPMGCKFCATGNVGYSRNLSSSEMLWEFLIARQLVQKVDNIVIMGMGEPFLNFNNVEKFIKALVLNKIKPFSARRITISTSGIKNFAKKMVELNLPVKLSISLHSPFDDIRKQLMPNSLTMSELLDECDFYAKNIDKRITFEYILIDGITDTEQSISELVKIAKRYSAFINLISYNEVEGIDYKSSKKERLITSYLDKENIRYSFRYKRGQKIKGACGQLVWERKKNQQS